MWFSLVTMKTHQKHIPFVCFCWWSLVQVNVTSRQGIKPQIIEPLSVVLPVMTLVAVASLKSYLAVSTHVKNSQIGSFPPKKSQRKETNKNCNHHLDRIFTKHYFKPISSTGWAKSFDYSLLSPPKKTFANQDAINVIRVEVNGAFR